MRPRFMPYAQKTQPLVHFQRTCPMDREMMGRLLKQLTTAFPVTIPGSPLLLLCLCLTATAKGNPLIFPEPQEIQLDQSHFSLDENVVILLPAKASEKDQQLAHILAAELSDRYGIALKTETASRLPSGKRFVLMGTVLNPLVQQYCALQGLQASVQKLRPEGYFLEVNPEVALIAGSDDRGAFYGLQSLRQLLDQSSQQRIQSVRVKDWPYKPLRGLRLYLPGRDHLPFFKRFLQDFMALYKFNTVFVEVNAGMRLDRHPELNAGWIEFAQDLNYSRRDRPTGPHEQFQDSAHHDTADGGVLEKQEVAELAGWARQHYIEVIPEIPSLTHSYYLLTRHRELAEITDAEWPDTYCPSNPKSYELLFDVFDEYIEVLKPKTLHIGHDEWRMPWGACSRCRGKDPSELFAQDVNKIYAYLTGKGVKVAMWGDHLVESVSGKGLVNRVSPSGFNYQIPGGLPAALVRERIPKDILVLNWFWKDGEPGEGEMNDVQLEEWGFRQAYGNLTPEIQNYGRRSSRSSVMGGVASSWAATTEFNIGKDLLYEFMGIAALVWSKHWPDPAQLTETVQALMPTIRRNLSGETLPSEEGDSVIPVNIAAQFNMASQEAVLGVDLTDLKAGRVQSGKKSFDLADTSLLGGKVAVITGSEGEPRNQLPREVQAAHVGADVSSLIFLHAAARPAANEKGYNYIYNFDDTADLLGMYEVVYEDGFIETIPIRYGVNILEWNWRKQPGGKYCYLADVVECGKQRNNPITFFAFEWKNPRLGKVVKEVNLKGSVRFKDISGRVMPNNAVILVGLSMVEKRSFPEPIQARSHQEGE